VATSEDIIKGRLYLEFQEDYFRDSHIRRLSDLGAVAMEEFYQEQRRFVEKNFQEEINYILIRVFVGKTDSQLVIKYRKNNDLEETSLNYSLNQDFREIACLLKRDLRNKKVKFTRFRNLGGGVDSLSDEDLKSLTTFYLGTNDSSSLENIKSVGAVQGTSKPEVRRQNGK